MLFVQILFFLLTFEYDILGGPAVQENQQVIYSINEYATTNVVRQGQDVPWGEIKRLQSSYILIRRKSEDLTYINITINGQFAYGGYFRLHSISGNVAKYVRNDNSMKEDFLLVNFPLSELSESQDHDESIEMKLLNYKTSYGLFIKF